LSMLDVTRTPMGGRRLRRWLRQPLLDKLEIERRHEHVSWFVAHERERAELFAALELTHDIERLLGRIRASVATAQEVLALAQSLEMLPRVRAVLQKETQKFGAALAALPTCDVALRAIRAAISEELPKRAAVNGVIRTGYSEELDRLRELLRNGRSFLADMEQRERARTGIKSLRVGFNKVFGHYIEITRPNLHLVPENYTRKQTLAAAERFITLELKEHESLVVNAQDRIAEMETSLFRQVCLEIGKSREEILAAAKTIAYLDAIASLADVAANFNYARPVISETPGLYIEEGRHPMLERAANIDEFVANDLALGGEGAPQIALITGPNMSGKSTYLRQTALIVLMAQAGSFVPAAAAQVGLCDRIFTRIGLYDRIGSGESTFMTEMTETAHILHHATARSLILLDELGRGTSTYDGLAVARAVLEYIHNHPHLRAQTLFATHYHELTELAELLPRLQNLHVEIAEQGSELVFLYKISAGVAEKSYGVYAAKLAGLPKPVVRRAAELLKAYEAGQQHNRQPHNAPPAANAKPLSTHVPSQLVRQLLELDPDALSPVEALMKLYEFRRLAEEDEEKSTDLRAKRTA
ncbi:MAG: DNA mismatch repair protein MutS, partial [Acidobacteriota bacterium]|nr:DNA mismatch repair protein MutS [Acidobacteriota bacterium]